MIQIAFKKEGALEYRFFQLSQLFEKVSDILTEEETKLIQQNLYYEKFLNNECLVKRAPTLTYLKTKDQKANIKEPSSQIEEATKSQIQESIMMAIMKAESVIQEIQQEETQPSKKIPKPSLQPYLQEQSKIQKPVTKKVSNNEKPSQSGTILPKIPKPSQQNAVPAKKVPTLGKYVLHKQSSMQTTYNSTYKAPTGSNRASSSSRQQNTSQQQTISSQQKAQNNQIPINIKASSTTVSAQSQITASSSSSKIQSFDSLSTSTNSNNQPTPKQIVKPSSQIVKQPQQIAHITEKQQEEVNQNDRESTQTLSTFQQPNDGNLFENLSRETLEKYYSAKKKAAKSEKNYIEQSKYFKDKQEKSKLKFLCSLSAHFNERKVVEERKIKEYIDHKETQDQGENEKDGIDSRLEYEELEESMQEDTNIVIETNCLIQYSSCLFDNLSSENNQIQLLNSLTSSIQLTDQFMLWCFIRSLQENIQNFKRKVDILLSKYDREIGNVNKRLSKMIDYIISVKKPQQLQNSKNKTFNILQYSHSDNCTLSLFSKPMQLQESSQEQSIQINSAQLNILFLETVSKYFIQDLQEEIAKNLSSKKFSLKLLQSHLILLRSLLSIVQNKGKRFPTFYLKNQIAEYFEDIEQ